MLCVCVFIIRGFEFWIYVFLKIYIMKYFLNLFFKVMVIRGKSFGVWLECKDKVLINGRRFSKNIWFLR